MTQPPPDYDVNETVVTETVTRPASALSPTLRMLLITLGVLAMLGLAWWLFQRAKPADPVTSNSQVIADPGPSQPPSNPGGTTNKEDGNGGTINSNSNNPDVTAPGGGTLDPASPPAPKPEGINPDQPLSGLNGSNPFKTTATTTDLADSSTPTNQTGSSSAGNTSESQPTAVTPVAPPVTITRPRIPQAEIDNAMNDNGVKVTQQPGSMTATFEAPTLPSTGSRRQPNTNQSGRNTNTTTGSTTGNSAKPPTATTSQNGPATTVQVPKTPTTPPVAGIALPGNTGTAAPVNTGTTPAGASATAALPNPGVPAVLGSTGDTNTDSAPAAQNTQPAAPDTSAIDTYLSSNQIALNAVVLGPTNTAILKTKQGFVVATVGQPITGSDIVLKSVTADSATLSVGNQTKTIPLDNKVSHE